MRIRKLGKGTGKSRGNVLPRPLFFLVFLLLWLSPLGAGAQNWLTRHYTSMDGLPNAFVFDMAQDSKGRMWFATIGGVCRYDGLNWDNLSSTDDLPYTLIRRVTIDSKDRPWVMVNQGDNKVHIFYRENNRWREMEILKIRGLSVFDISFLHLVEKEEKTPAATKGNAGRHLPRVFIGTQKQGLHRLHNGSWTKISTRDGLPGNQISGMTSHGNVAYISTDKGIAKLTEEEDSFSIDSDLHQRLKLPPGLVLGINTEWASRFPGSTLKKNRVWVCGPQWLARFDAGETNPKVLRFGRELFNNEFQQVAVQPDYYFGLFLCASYKIYFYNYRDGTLDITDDKNGLVNMGANTALSDRERNIWLSNRRGVIKIYGRYLAGFKTKHGMLENEVTAVLEMKPGLMALGHRYGLSFYDGENFRQLPFFASPGTGPRRCRVMDMKKDSRGNLWVAAMWQGVAKVTGRKDIQWYNPHPLPSVAAIWVDDRDRVLLGTEGGLFRMEGEKVVLIPIGAFNPPNIRRITGDEKGNIYLSTTFSGIYAGRPSGDGETFRWTNYRDPANRRFNSTYGVFRDHKDRLLICSSAGAYHIAGEKLQLFEEAGFSLKKTTFFILEDNRRRLWFGTDNGVVRWDGKQQYVYSVGEGLAGQETNRAAGYMDSRGHLWFGTDNGLSVYNSDYDPRDSWNPPPWTYLLHLDTGARKVPLQEPAHLAYNERNLVFHFRGTSFLNEESIRFKYKLEGFDPGWTQDSPHGQKVRYTNLPPGTYRFHLQAANNLDAWSPPLVSAAIHIASPFYKQWWFLLFSALLLLMGMRAVIRFIEEKRQARRLEQEVKDRTGQLLASEKRYRELFEESQDTVFTTDAQGMFLDINPAGVELLGCGSRKEVLSLGLDANICLTQTDCNTFRESIGKKGFVKDYELSLKKKDGEIITVLITATVQRGPRGNVIALRGIMRDITETNRMRRQLEQARKLEAIGRLAGGIAHDFNNILAVVSGYIEMTLEDLPEGDPLRENVEQVFIASNRAKGLVRQILTFSRQDVQERGPIKVAPIIKEVLKLLRSSIPNTVELELDICAENTVIHANLTHIHQVLLNLCTNAIHAMRKDGGILTVSMEETELAEEEALRCNNLPPGRYLKLTVRDTGHGIEPGIIKRIFDPYFTTKQQGDGSGMGLAVTHGIVKSSGGDISVESEPGKGACFDVLLPAVDAVEELPDTGGGPVPRGMKEHILVVDDEDMIRVMLQQILEKLGYRVSVRGNCKCGMELFSSKPEDFQLVIADVTLPGMNGIQFVREIREIRPEIPVIMCTGFSDSITPKQLKELKVHSLLLKPLGTKELARAINSALGKEGGKIIKNEK